LPEPTIPALPPGLNLVRRLIALRTFGSSWHLYTDERDKQVSPDNPVSASEKANPVPIRGFPGNSWEIPVKSFTYGKEGEKRWDAPRGKITRGKNNTR